MPSESETGASLGQGADPALPRAESIHECFRRSREAAKRLRIIALVLEVAVVAIGGWRFLTHPRPALFPLIILVATVFEVIFRYLVDNLRTYGQQCRRNSARAFAAGTDSDPVMSANLLIALPRLASLLTPFHKDQPLASYYSFSDLVPGDQRLRAITAYSAFFSARVLAIWRTLLLIALGCVAAGGILLLYELALNPSAPAGLRYTYVDALFTILWWYATIRLLRAFLVAHHLASMFGRIFDLIEQTVVGGRTLHELVESYDYGRASGVEAPTLVYRWSRRTIDKQWSIVRSTFMN